MNFAKQYELYKNNVNEYLTKSFSGREGRIYDAMTYSLFAGGKRIRPVLSVAACDALDGNVDMALCFGCAVEMIHNYSLIHDDLPGMDNDSMRRGMPTNHIKFGEATAILAGDGLLNFACETICKSSFDDKHKVLALANLYSASGSEGMIGGQMIDIMSENKKINAQTLDELHRKKTGALINASASMGAISAEKDKNILYGYSSSLGLAFQIRDDILDVCGNSEKFGKPINSDERNNKSTYVTFYGLDGAKKKLAEETEKAITSIDFLGGKGEFLRSFATFLLNRES